MLGLTDQDGDHVSSWAGGLSSTPPNFKAHADGEAPSPTKIGQAAQDNHHRGANNTNDAPNTRPPSWFTVGVGILVPVPPLPPTQIPPPKKHLSDQNAPTPAGPKLGPLPGL